MLDTKRDWQKLSGRQGYHFVISFRPGETDEETAFHLVRDFCEQYLGENYDYCFSIHNDRAHMHGHIIFNSVNRVSGYKYRYADGDWEKEIQPVTDTLCRKYGQMCIRDSNPAWNRAAGVSEHGAGRNPPAGRARSDWGRSIF